MDGGHALLHQTSQLLPLVNVQRCALHVLDDMVKNREDKEDRRRYATLINMAAGRRKHAEAIYALISPNSIVKKMPKAHVCANFLPDGVCTHGVRRRTSRRCRTRCFCRCASRRACTDASSCACTRLRRGRAFCGIESARSSVARSRRPPPTARPGRRDRAAGMCPTCIRIGCAHPPLWHTHLHMRRNVSACRAPQRRLAVTESLRLTPPTSPPTFSCAVESVQQGERAA